MTSPERGHSCCRASRPFIAVQFAFFVLTRSFAMALCVACRPVFSDSRTTFIRPCLVDLALPIEVGGIIGPTRDGLDSFSAGAPSAAYTVMGKLCLGALELSHAA